MYKIDSDNCMQCGLCAANCPENAIAMIDGNYEINQDKCSQCGTCADNCPAAVIEKF